MIYDAIVTESKLGTVYTFYKVGIIVDEATYYKIKKKYNALNITEDIEDWMFGLEFVEDSYSDLWKINICQTFEISPFKNAEDVKNLFMKSGYFVMFHNTPECFSFIELKKLADGIK